MFKLHWVTSSAGLLSLHICSYTPRWIKLPFLVDVQLAISFRVKLAWQRCFCGYYVANWQPLNLCRSYSAFLPAGPRLSFMLTTSGVRCREPFIMWSRRPADKTQTPAGRETNYFTEGELIEDFQFASFKRSGWVVIALPPAGVK